MGSHTDDNQNGGQKYALGIECSNPSARGSNRGEVGLGKFVESGDLVFVGSVGLSQDARGSDGLVSAIDELCKTHDVDASQIARIVVSVGPGGYTALRISVTVAKMLARVIGCPVVPVESAAVAAMGFLEESSGVVIALASKNGKAHCTKLINGELAVLGVIDGQGVVESGAAVLVGDEHLPKEMIEAANEAGIEVRPIELSARACLEASLGFGGRFGEVEASGLGVAYAREPDAVTQWRALHGG